MTILIPEGNTSKACRLALPDLPAIGAVIPAAIPQLPANGADWQVRTLEMRLMQCTLRVERGQRDENDELVEGHM